MNLNEVVTTPSRASRCVRNLNFCFLHDSQHIQQRKFRIWVHISLAALEYCALLLTIPIFSRAACRSSRDPTPSRKSAVRRKARSFDSGVSSLSANHGLVQVRRRAPAVDNSEVNREQPIHWKLRHIIYIFITRNL